MSEPHESASTEPRWEIVQDEQWYYVFAFATCPLCGAELYHEEPRRASAGEPDPPKLTLTVTDQRTVELSAEGLMFPMVVHRCETASTS